MTFSEAVKSGFDHYTKFDGRAARPAYWWWFLFAILVGIGAEHHRRDSSATFGVVSGLAGLALLLPGLSVSIRRLHDINRSGWWILIFIVPIIGFIVWLVCYCARAIRVRTSTGRLRWRESRHPAPHRLQ